MRFEEHHTLPNNALECETRNAYFDVVSRRRRASVRGVIPAAVNALSEHYVQLEFFPEPRYIEAVDPRVAIGPDTRVAALIRVRYGEARQVHQVYRDRHGWYCAEHGPGCAAVSDAVDAARAR